MNIGSAATKAPGQHPQTWALGLLRLAHTAPRDRCSSARLALAIWYSRLPPEEYATSLTPVLGQPLRSSDPCWPYGCKQQASPTDSISRPSLCSPSARYVLRDPGPRHTMIDSVCRLTQIQSRSKCPQPPHQASKTLASTHSAAWPVLTDPGYSMALKVSRIQWTQGPGLLQWVRP